MKKCHFFLLLVLSLLSVSIFTSRDASAVNPVGTEQYALIGQTSGFGHVTNYVDYTWNNDYPLNQSANDWWVNIPFSALSNINLMSLRLNKSIPANSLVSLKIVWQAESVGYTSVIKYDGLQFEHNRSYLWDSCQNIYGQPQNISGRTLTLTCNYIFYNSSETAIIDSIYGSHIFEVVHQSDVDDHLNVVISQVTSITLSNNGLSSDDRTWLESVIGSNSSDVSSVVSKLNEVKSEQQATTNAVNNLNRTMEESNDDAQSRWEADKAEEAEREEQGKDDSDEVLSIFNFNFSNPFAPLLSMFSSSQCVNIPTISSWFHSSTNLYCSWWPQSVRNVATPIFALGSSMLLFGFLVRWIKTKDGVQVS